MSERRSVALSRAWLYLAIAIAFGIQGCADQDRYAQLGTVTGALLGAYIGSHIGDGRGKTLATAGGAALGALFGQQLGRILDRKDKQMMEQASVTALNSDIGVPVAWNNSDTGHRGSVKSVDETENVTGSCRKIEQQVIINDNLISKYATACRDHNGDWYLQES